MNCSGADCVYSEFLIKKNDLVGEAVKIRAVDTSVGVDLHPEKVGLDRLPQDQKRTLVLHPTSHGLSEVSLRLLQKRSRSKKVRLAEHSLYDLYLLFAFAETHRLVGPRKVLVTTIYHVLHHVSVHCPKPEEMVEVYKLTKPKSVLRHMLQDLRLRYHNLDLMPEPMLDDPKHKIMKQTLVEMDYTSASPGRQIDIDLIALHTQDRQLTPPYRMFGPKGDDKYLTAQYVDIEAIHQENRQKGRYGRTAHGEVSPSSTKCKAGSRAGPANSKAPEVVDNHAMSQQEPVKQAPSSISIVQPENVGEVVRGVPAQKSAPGPDQSLNPHGFSKEPSVCLSTSAVPTQGDHVPSSQARPETAAVKSSPEMSAARGNAAAPNSAPTGPITQDAAKHILTRVSTGPLRFHDNTAPPKALAVPASSKHRRLSVEAHSNAADRSPKKAKVSSIAATGVRVNVSLQSWNTKKPGVQEIRINRERLKMIEPLAQRLSEANKTSNPIVEVREVNGAELEALLDFVEVSSNSHNRTLSAMIRAGNGALHICGKGQVYRKLLNATSARLCEEKLQVKDLNLFYSTRRDLAVATVQTASKECSPTRGRPDTEVADAQTGRTGPDAAFHTLEELLALAALAASRSETVAEALRFWKSRSFWPGFNSDLIMAHKRRKVHERVSATFARSK